MKKFLRKFFDEDNLAIVKFLYYINAIYSNPVYYNKYLKNEKLKYDFDSLYKKITYKGMITSSIAITFIYTMVFLPIDFYNVPMTIDLIVLMYSLVAFLLLFGTYFNVLYENKDYTWYSVLPINEKTICNVKLTVVAQYTLQMLMPIVSCITLFYIRNLHMKIGLPLSIVVGMIIAIAYYLIISIIIVCLDIFVLNKLAKTKVITKFKNSVLNILNVVGTMILVGFIIFMQNMSRRVSLSVVDGTYKRELSIFSTILLNPIYNIIFLVGIFIIIFFLYRKSIHIMTSDYYSFISRLQTGIKRVDNSKRRNIKNKVTLRNKAYLTNETDVMNDVSSMNETIVINDVKSINEKNMMNEASLVNKVDEMNNSYAIKEINAMNNSKNTKNLFYKYNIKMISDSNIFMQSVFFPFFFMAATYMPLMVNFINEVQGEFLTIVPYAAVLVFGIYIGLYPRCLGSLIFSLEGESFEYIKSLPINRKKYFLRKLNFSAMITSIIPIIAITIGMIFLKINIIHILIADVLLYLLLFLLMSFWCFNDYEKPYLSWQNTATLMNRVNMAFSFMYMIVVMIMTIVVIGVSIGVVVALGVEYVIYILMGLYAIIALLGIGNILLRIGRL